MNAAQPRCPRCGAIGRPGTYFCVACGSRYHAPISADLLALTARRRAMVEQPWCRRCDIPVRAGGRYCPSCGLPLQSAPAWAAAAR
jgi:RNA polymerase subunit RPABC4/transcription elongation factor Spt4